MSSEPTFIIGAQTDVFHHAQSDCEDAARLAGLRIDAVKAVTIDARIKRLLSARSYEATKGRRMVEIFTLSKPS